MRRKERDKMNTLEEIKNTIVLLRDDPCQVSSLLTYRQCCKYCPIAVDIEGNGVYKCMERAFLHQSLTHSEVVPLTDGWKVTVRHVRLLQ